MASQKNHFLQFELESCGIQVSKNLDLNQVTFWNEGYLHHIRYSTRYLRKYVAHISFGKLSRKVPLTIKRDLSTDFRYKSLFGVQAARPMLEVICFTMRLWQQSGFRLMTGLWLQLEAKMTHRFSFGTSKQKLPFAVRLKTFAIYNFQC